MEIEQHVCWKALHLNSVMLCCSKFVIDEPNFVIFSSTIRRNSTVEMKNDFMTFSAFFDPTDCLDSNKTATISSMTLNN